MGVFGLLLYIGLVALTVPDVRCHSDVFQILSQDFQQVASERGLNITEIIKFNFFQLANITSKQLNVAVNKSIGPGLINLLNTTSIETLKNYYAGFDSILGINNYNASLYAFVRYALFVDRPLQTQTIISQLHTLHNISYVSNVTVANLLNTTLRELIQRHYLSDVYPKLRNVLTTTVSNNIGMYTGHVGLSVSQFQELVGPRFMKNLTRSRVKFALAFVSGNVHSIEILTQQIVYILSHAAERLSPAYLLKLNETSTKCNILPSSLSKLTVDRVAQICINVTFPVARTMFLMGGFPKQFIWFAEDFTIDELDKMLNVSGFPDSYVANVRTINLFFMLQTVSIAAKKIQQNAALPSVVIAARKNINPEDIPKLTILGLAEKILGLSGSTLAKLYNLSAPVESEARNTRFVQLPILVHRYVNVTFDVKSFYTLSLPHIIQAFLVHRNITEGLKDFQQDLDYIMTNLTLGEIRKIYHIEPKEFLENSIEYHLLKRTGFSRLQLMKRLGENVSSRMLRIENLLNNVRLGDAQIVLNLQQSLLNYTPSQIRKEVAGLGLLSMTLFTPPIDLLTSRNISSSILNTTSLVKLIEYAGVEETNISFIFEKLNASRPIISILKEQPVTVLTKALDIPRGKMRHFTVFRIIEEVVTNLFRVGEPKIPSILRRPLFVLGRSKNLNKTTIMSRSLFWLVQELTDVNWQFLALIQALGAKPKLIETLNSTSLQQMGQSFPILLNHLPQFRSANFSIMQLMTNLIYLDSPKATKMILGELFKFRQELLLTNVIVASIVNVTTDNLPRQPYLTKVYLLLKQKIGTEVNKTTADFIANTLKITPQVYKAMKLMEISRLSDVRRNLSIAIVDSDKPNTMRLWSVIRKIYDKELLRFFGRSLHQANETCGIQAQRNALVQLTLANVVTKCLNVSFAYFSEIARHAGKGRMVTYFPMFKISEISQISNVTYEQLLNYNISLMGKMVLKEVTEVELKAVLPIVLVSYRTGISVRNIPTYTLSGLAQKTLKLPLPLIAKLFNIPNTVVVLAQNLTFKALPFLMQQEVNVTYAVSHFYHLSFISLLEAQNTTELSQALEQNIRYIVTKLPIRDIQMMYAFTEPDFLDHSLLGLLERNANISSRELAKAISLTLPQEMLLKNVRISDAQIILNLSNNNLFKMTSNEIGHKILKFGREGVILFNPLKSLSVHSNMTSDALSKLSFINILKVAKFPRSAIDSLLRSLNITQSSQLALIFDKHPILDFAGTLNLTTSQVQRKIIFRLWRQVIGFFSQDIDKCAMFTTACNANASCENIPNAVRCICKRGYNGPRRSYSGPRKDYSGPRTGWNCFDIDECHSQSICQQPNAICHNTVGSFKCNCKSGYSGNATKCDDVDECVNSSALCHKDATCINLRGSYKCRCKSGFAGSGKSCYDACTSKSCPRDSDCQSVPGKGSAFVCRCIQSGYSYSRKNRKCKRIAGERIFTIKGVKFEQTYNGKYADKNSKEFKSKAAELGNGLFLTICSRVGCTAIEVTAIKSGSIVVDFNAMFPSNRTALTANQIQTATIQALNDPQLADFNPDKSTIPRAEVSNLCETGGDDCGSNADCIPESSGTSYSCRCKEGYEKKDDKCSKKSNILVTVVPVVIGILILIAIIVILSYKYCRKDKDADKTSGHPYALFNASTSIADVGVSGSELGQENKMASF